ncbi:DUF2812 domain-containing protein [Alkalihalobacillus trypoxylicola]|uniref:DUF2812 domain-containing protein n=1 Tax=Alkalihalobacillus trypoxylicola TaxID=519424 RepID=A0A162E5B9_9BACI|nr:DUF2812 domain-containing protein [Alkalihalobacillus trypoxylicola]KYG31765.1 hypothetical protein AZF04_02995 [Alkalihalobacillus trypoxylicola]
MKKFKHFYDFNSEEKWLNDMAKQGFQLIKSTSWSYKFTPSKPENTKIKLDYRVFKKHEDYEDYLALFEDSGWKHISGTYRSGHQYFKQIKDHASDDIFSDGESRAARYKRLSDKLTTIAYCLLPIWAVIVTLEMNNWNDGTPLFASELWGKNWTEFWRTFFPETFFSTIRLFLLLVFPFTILVNFSFAFKANKLFKQQLEK